MKKTKQFTIIEMLVVLAIISLIVGMLLTGIGIARESARETRAKAEMQQIKMAVTQYKSTYKGFPFPHGDYPNILGSKSSATSNGGSEGDYEDFMDALKGTNPRKQAFIKGTLEKSPWGGDYYIVIDKDYENSVNPNDTGYTNAPNEDIADVVAVWCENKDGDILGTWE